MWRGGAIGAAVGAVLGILFAAAMNRFGLSFVDLAQQDYLSGGMVNSVVSAGIAAVAGFFLGTIVALNG